MANQSTIDVESNFCASEIFPLRHGATSMPNEDPNGADCVNREREGNISSFSTENLYVAGRILHIYQTDGRYKLKINTAFNYKPLLLRPNYIKDHFPQFTQKALNVLGTSSVLTESDVLSVPAQKVKTLFKLWNGNIGNKIFKQKLENNILQGPSSIFPPPRNWKNNILQGPSSIFPPPVGFCKTCSLLNAQAKLQNIIVL
ncbi:hypothetical protein CEXT_549401 [Caerostris extrusa]|uniref:Uncharacterized protein n=1 Tax=Caerostris extrusa TaxID=172846 RepID=A0AAV4MMR6_CAEEX|nr:hypothetical protein CEXT_549401 [Caerostris extrusa]